MVVEKEVEKMGWRRRSGGEGLEMEKKGWRKRGGREVVGRRRGRGEGVEEKRRLGRDGGEGRTEWRVGVGGVVDKKWEKVLGVFGRIFKGRSTIIIRVSNNSYKTRWVLYFLNP